MGDQWKFKYLLTATVIDHIENTTLVVEMKDKFHLTDNESAAITYYTCDVRNMGGTIDECPFQENQ